MDNHEIVSEFTDWVEKEPGDIRHHNSDPLSDFRAKLLGRHSCAVGCFSRASEYTEDELIEALKAVVPVVYEMLNDSRPATYAQLHRLLVEPTHVQTN